MSTVDQAFDQIVGQQSIDDVDFDAQADAMQTRVEDAADAYRKGE